jgi:hypothetical protein
MAPSNPFSLREKVAGEAGRMRVFAMGRGKHFET